MATPEYQRVYESAKAGGELLMHLGFFSEKLRQARLVEPSSDQWTRLGALVSSDHEMFRHVAFSSDYEFRLDSDGNIYVSKDHALNIRQWDYDRTTRKLEIARNSVCVLAALVALAILGRCIA